MAIRTRHPILSLTLGTAIFGGTLWSTPSQACSTEDYISSVCAMAAATLRDFGDQFMYADGRILPINSYAALYALIGGTYGPSSSTQFRIPDLRGRMVVGAGQGPGLPAFNIGEAAGNVSFTLTESQLPAHSHMVSLPVDISGMTANTTLSGLSATANLGGVQVSGQASGLNLNVSSTSGGNATPGTTLYLGKAGGPQGALYSSSAPNTTLNSGSISGNLNLTIANGTTAPVNISGTADTTIGGTASVTGATGTTGQGQAVYFMPPYLAMKYYIAVTGLFPSND